MSKLVTYLVNDDPFQTGVAAIDRRDGEPLPELVPGTFVERPGQGGFGIVVARNNDELAVLWSQPPPQVPHPLSGAQQVTIDLHKRGMISTAELWRQFNIDPRDMLQ